MKTPHFAADVAPENRQAQLLADAAKLPDLVQTLKHNRHSMCVPAQADDYDLLLTRIADLVPLVHQSQPNALPAATVELVLRGLLKREVPVKSQFSSHMVPPSPEALRHNEAIRAAARHLGIDLTTPGTPA